MPSFPSPPSATLLSPVNAILAPFDMNPERCDRATYTRGLIAPALPEDAAAAWLVIVLKLRALYRVLGSHDAMEPNLSQTFSTPANSKNKVYHMWDFVGRTLHMAYLVPASLEHLSPDESERFRDVLTRSMLTVSLLKDDSPGRLNALVETNYPEESDKHPELGAEVGEATRQLDWVLEGL